MASATSSPRSAMPLVRVHFPVLRPSASGWQRIWRRPSCAPTARPAPGSSAPPRRTLPRQRRSYFKDIDLPVLTATIATYQKLGNWTPHVEITRAGVRRDPRHLPACRAHHPAARLRRRRRSAASLRIRDHGRHLGWIGVGSMGHRMSRHLVAAGHALVVADAASTAQAPPQARIAKSNAEVAGLADTIILSLPDGSVSRGVSRGNWRQPRRAGSRR